MDSAPAQHTALRRLGIVTVGDLLTHYPRRYEDRREFAGFPREESDQAVCLCGEVIKTRFNHFGRGQEDLRGDLAGRAMRMPSASRSFCAGSIFITFRK